MLESLMLLAVGAIGGAVNAAAGGAKLFVFPLLLALGVPPVAANATGTVSLWPAQGPAIWVYRKELSINRQAMFRVLLPCLLGSAAGAFTLIFSGEKVFLAMVPWFIGAAVITIVLGKRLTNFLHDMVALKKLKAASILLLFGAGFYGGFFGAGLGFMLLAVLALTNDADLQKSNAFKNLLVFLINSTAVLPLAWSGLVAWNLVPYVLVGGLIGGFVGARLAKRLPEAPLRIFVALLGLVLSITFLLREQA